MVCFRYIIVTTLHKGYNKDDDDADDDNINNNNNDNNNNNNKVPHCNKNHEVMNHIARHEFMTAESIQWRCKTRHYGIKKETIHDCKRYHA